MKKIVLMILSIILVCFCISDIQVFAQADKWDRQGAYGTKAEFTIDTTEKSGNGEYSIKIKNIDYGVTRVEKTFEVKPNTKYRATVMAKCIDFDKATDPKYDFGNFGAVLAKAQQVPKGVSHIGSDWKKLTYCFESGDEESFTLALYNAGNKGTVYFSDFKLEEMPKESNEWNLCVVYLKNIEAPFVQNGEEKILAKKFCQEDMDYCTDTINQLYSYMNLLSEGKMDIRSIDFYECDKTIKTLSSNGNGNYSINNNDKALKEELDKIITNAEDNSGKRYDQIILVSPLPTEMTGKLGVNMYTDNIIQVYVNHLEFSNTLLATFVHEILHSVEYVSNQIDPENTVPLHAYEDQYAQYYRAWQNGLPGNCTWFSDYMRRTTPDGKGLNEKAFYTSGNSKSVVVYGNTKKGSYPKTDVGTLELSKISDKIYTGKEIKPTVTLKNGNKKLVCGEDYTVSYTCNTDIGIASAIIKGKGEYSGTVKQSFYIRPSKPELSVVQSGNSYSLSWEASKGATGYEIYGSVGNKESELLKTIDATDTGAYLNTEIVSDGKQYVFEIRAFRKLYPQIFYSIQEGKADENGSNNITDSNNNPDLSGLFATYDQCKFVKDAEQNIRCYYADGTPVINEFKCDGTYTYYFQADATAMKDRLTYHPDGVHVIYFDENGHEVFSDFANVKKTITGEKVDDYCFFDVYGYLYVDVVTYDRTGTYLYYANPYGVMDRGKWFEFSDNVKWADGTPFDKAGGKYGYANADGTLMINQWTYDWEGRYCYMQGNGVALYKSE